LPVFLKAEMWHIYRQMAGLQAYRPLVLTHRRENAASFPWPDDQFQLVPRPPGVLREVRGWWCKRIARAPIMIFPGEARRLAARLQSANAALLHTYFGHIGLYLLPLLETWPGPKIVSYHGADAGVDVARPAWGAASRRMFAAADLIIARSEHLLENLRALGCPPEKLALHRTGIPLDQFPARQPDPPAPADGRWRLFQACRLIEKKGLWTTLEAFRRFRETWPQAELVIAGEGPMDAALRAKAAEFFPDDPAAVRLPGFLSQADLRAELAAAHIFLHPSETAADGNVEGVPNSMLEAMATGLPIAATRHGGIPEALTHGRGGLLVAERDAPALADALLQIARPEAYAAFSHAAAAEVREKFDLARQVRVLEDLYDLAIQRAKSR
jgi:colanic acid/amylovoran biosynthesis glycosyltransferase